MSRRLTDPPPEIAGIDFAALIDAMRLRGALTYSSSGVIANRIHQVTVAGLVATTDFRKGRGCRVWTDRWEVRGAYEYETGRFLCSSFWGDPEACILESTILRVSL
jgi:hypothetical protein